MVIQCEKCQTRFRLDDSKVKESGVKVRCTKCKHVFTVQKETPESFDSANDEAGFAAFSAAAGSKSVNETPAVQPPESAAFSVDTEESINFGEVSFTSDSESRPSFESDNFDASSIAFDSSEQVSSAIDDTKGHDIGFSEFDFGEAADSDAPTPQENSSPVTPDPQSTRKEALQSLDFSDDDMFGSVVQSAPEAAEESISFDFGEDSFSEAMETGSHNTGNNSSSKFSLETSGDAPFSLGEIDFGDELSSVAVQQVNPEDLKPSQNDLFSPLAGTREQSAGDFTPSFSFDNGSDEKQEMQQLSIASRRKQNPLSGIVIVVAAILIVSVLGYFGYSTFLTPKDSISKQAGKITLQDVTAAFINNEEAGELLVVSGKALNEFPKIRAALQVKVTVTDPAGQGEISKTAYCGNPLTDEQLESLPLSKIEAAMANQFGDSLSNMEVAPGKAIPFVVVVANLPKAAKDFTVQPAGSTVATGKQ